MRGANDSSDDPWVSSLPYVLSLSALFAAIVWYTWALWGDALVDFGGALHRAERISDGAVLYRDVLSHYPPVAPYLMGGVLALFGKHLNVVYLSGLFVLILESCLLWYVARRFLDRLETSLGLASFWILLAFKPGLFNWVLPNVFANTFVCLFATAVVAAIASDITQRRNSRLLIASLLVGVTGLTKLEYGGATYGTLVFYVFFVRAAPISGAKITLRDRFADLVRASVPGGVLALVAVAVISLQVPLQEIIFDNVYRIRSFSQVLNVYLQSLFPPLLHEIGRAGLAYAVGFGVAGWLAALGVRRVGNAVPDFLVTIFFFALAGGIVCLVSWHVGSELRMRPHEAAIAGIMLQFTWVPFAAFVLAICALFFRERLGSSVAWRALAVTAVFALLVTLRWNFRLAWAPFYGFFAPFLLVWGVSALLARLVQDAAAQKISLVVVFGVWMTIGASIYRVDYLDREIAIESPRGVLYQPIWNAVPINKIVNFLAPKLEPGQSVAVIPEEQFINFVLGAPHPTRDTGIGPGWLATPEDEQRFLDEVLSRDTPFLVLSSRSYTEFGAGMLPEYEPELIERLLKHYLPIRQMKGKGSIRFIVFERKEAPSGEPAGSDPRAS